MQDGDCSTLWSTLGSFRNGYTSIHAATRRLYRSGYYNINRLDCITWLFSGSDSAYAYHAGLFLYLYTPKYQGVNAVSGRTVLGLLYRSKTGVHTESSSYESSETLPVCATFGKAVSMVLLYLKTAMSLLHRTNC